MKKILSAAAVLSVILMTAGCSIENNMNYQDNSVKEEYATESVTSVSEDDQNESNNEKSYRTAEERLNFINSSEFYGYDNDTPYLSRGTGKVKPKNYVAPDYFYTCENAQITDPVLLKMTEDFIDESRKSLRADFERFAAFYMSEIPPENAYIIDTNVSIYNDFCIVECSGRINMVRRFSEELVSKSNCILGNIGCRCAYFSISEHRRLEVSDLFFKDVDFTTETYRNLHKKYGGSGNNEKFTGLNKEFFMIFPSSSDSWYVKISDFSPYKSIGSNCDIYDNRYDFYQNCCVFADPVKYGTDVFTGETKFVDISEWTDIRYGADNRFEEMFYCPIESNLLNNDIMENIKQIASDELEEYTYCDPYDDIGPVPDNARCTLRIKYLKDLNIFHVYIAHYMNYCKCGNIQRYYDADSLKELSVNELLNKAIGDNWRDYFTDSSVDMENVSMDNLVFRYNRTDFDKCTRTFFVYPDGSDVVTLDFTLKNGKWIPEEKIENE